MPLDHNSILKTQRSAIKTHLDAGNTDIPNEKQTAWLNTSFKPPEDELWMSEHLTVINEQRSSTGLLEFNGIIEYRMKVRLGTGTVIANDAAVVLKGLYKPGTSLTVDGVSVHTYRTRQLAGRQEDETWYVVPVQLFVRSFATTTP